MLKDPRSGELKLDGIANRRQLLQKVAELIPELKSRREGKIAKPGNPAGVPLPGYPETLMPIAAANAPNLQVPGTSSGGGSSKKKNKGKDKS